MAGPERKKPTYIYEIRYDIHNELCRVLDMDDCWKELAGEYMEYRPFEINEIEQKSKRLSTSPTHQLFIEWGKQNHRVSELFVLLYKMEHVTAMNCLAPELDSKYLKLLYKLERKINVNSSNNEDKIKDQLNNNVQEDPTKAQPNSESGSISLPIKSEEVKSELNKVAAIPLLKYEDLKRATNNWSEDNWLGKGGFGTVYKGEWNLLPVAVKKLAGDDGQYKELIREMCVNQYRYDFILPLYGYSIGGNEACLVYQLMSGGSLERRIRGGGYPPLTWPQRYRIAHGVARGLQFLHNVESVPLIHGDIKPANILLDQYLMPKIGDFGLARKVHFDKLNSQVSKVVGTPAYLPSEYVWSRVASPAVDVYSFGVLALELATALPALSAKRKVPRLGNLVRSLRDNHYSLELLEDPALRGTPESNPFLCKQIILIGLDCTEEKGENRPTMLEVYKRLDALQYS